VRPLLYVVMNTDMWVRSVMFASIHTRLLLGELYAPAFYSE